MRICDRWGSRGRALLYRCRIARLAARGTRHETARCGRAASVGGQKGRRRPAVPNGAGPRLLSAQDAAAYTGFNYTTLRGAALRGHLPVVRIPGSRRMWFDRADLDRAIAEWKRLID